MKKLILAVMAGAFAQPLLATTYNGGGFGLGEACSTKYQPSFFNGDCQKTGVVLRGLGGYRFNNYFSAEVSADGLISPWKLFGLNDVETESVSAFTLGGHAFLSLPITRESRLFFGPSVGASLVYTSRDETSQSNYTTQQSEAATEEDYDFSWNYGWAAGIEFVTQQDKVIRLQWQNWRALNSKIAFGGEVNANYLTINFISRF